MDLILLLQYILSLLMLAVVVYALSVLKKRLLQLSAVLSHKALRRKEFS